MRTKTQEQTIDLVRIKSWFIPKDAISYQCLRSLKVPLIIFHRDFLPTLELATKRHDVNVVISPWAKILEDRLDKVGEIWLSKPDRTCRLTDKKLIFTAKANKANREAIARLEASMAQFFSRWSCRYYPLFSETPEKLKLVVDFKFDPELQPIVPSVPPEELQEHELILGFTKIKLTFKNGRSALGAPNTLLEVFTKTGVEWTTIHTGTFPNTDIGCLDQFLHAVANLHARRKFND